MCVFVHACVHVCAYKAIIMLVFTVPVGGGSEVDSWEDIVADDPKPTATGNTQQPSAVQTQATTISSESAITTDTTIVKPSSKEPTSSQNNQKEVDDTPSNEAVKTNETQAAGVSNNKSNDSVSELKAKEEQGDQPSPSNTPVSKAKVITTPQRAEDAKENVNIVFIGHVDAGKSTIGGHVMLVCTI